MASNNRLTTISKIRRLNPTNTRGSSSRSGGVLHSIFRHLLYYDGGDIAAKWDSLMERYLRDPKNSFKTDRVSLSQNRGNTNKALMKSDMSWKKFLTGMRFCNFVKIEVSVTAYRANGSKAAHTETVNLGELTIDDHEENKDD